MDPLLPVFIGILLAIAAFAAIGWVLYIIEHGYRLARMVHDHQSRIDVQHLRARLLTIESIAAAAHRDTPTVRLASLQCEVVGLLADMETAP